jgi:hypothetical protein
MKYTKLNLFSQTYLFSQGLIHLKLPLKLSLQTSAHLLIVFATKLVPFSKFPFLRALELLVAFSSIFFFFLPGTGV